jgi:SAM-dependent methyltransferase
VGREGEHVQLRLKVNLTSPEQPAEDSLEYRCNLCGAKNRRPVAQLGREASSCSECESTGRLRALAWLISDELFGAQMPFSEFPVIRSWTALGMSDLEDFAAPLAAKFSYTNTYYHKPPLFDITRPDPATDGKFDFIISSEVMEHVPDPVAPAFETLYRMLKPNGVLFLTVPYSLEATAIEHFPEMHDFAVTALRDRWVLVNRTRDGRLQTFDDLVFHGGPGSTLEMRVFNETTLRKILVDAGFHSIRMAGEACLEYGILPDDPWSLPIAARKGGRVLESAGLTELAGGYAAIAKQLHATDDDLKKTNADYTEHVGWATRKVAELEREMAKLLDWGHAIEKDSDDHLAHIAQLQSMVKEAEEEFEKLTREFEQRTAWALGLQKENEALTARCDAFENSGWLRLGRRLRLAK